MIRRELGWFLIIGCTVTLIDYLIYNGLLSIALCGTGTAKAIGFMTGTVCTYFANRLLTFRHHATRSGSVIRFGLLYAMTMSANVGVNSGMLEVLPDQSWRLTLAFVIATGVSAVLNFIGMKLFVFRAAALNSTS